jgi:succinate dehydrogenase flavin-adding protein (antitoxin of CptAB toxin-antitoxin module)
MIECVLLSFFIPSLPLPYMQIPTQLLTLPDWTIYYWSVGRQAPSEEWADSKVLGVFFSRL